MYDSIYVKFSNRQTNLQWKKVIQWLHLVWGNRLALTRKLHKGARRQGPCYILMRGWLKGECAFVTTHQTLYWIWVYLQYVNFFLHLQRKREKMPLGSKVWVKPQWSWAQLFLITIFLHELICNHLFVLLWLRFI